METLYTLAYSLYTLYTLHIHSTLSKCSRNIEMNPAPKPKSQA